MKKKKIFLTAYILEKKKKKGERETSLNAFWCKRMHSIKQNTRKRRLSFLQKRKEIKSLEDDEWCTLLQRSPFSRVVDWKICSFNFLREETWLLRVLCIIYFIPTRTDFVNNERYYYCRSCREWPELTDATRAVKIIIKTLGNTLHQR